MPMFMNPMRRPSPIAPSAAPMAPQSNGMGFFDRAADFRTQNPGVLSAFGDSLLRAGGSRMGGGQEAALIQANGMRNQTAKYLVDHGLADTPEEAMMLAQNPTLMSTLFKDNTIANQFGARKAIAEQIGLVPGTPQYQQYVAAGSFDNTPAGGTYADRAAAAQQLGLNPGDPAYQGYVLTGRMPKEDQGPLTATDKKAILEADEMVSANTNAIAALDQAEKISDNANAGWFAGARASAGNNLPDWAVPDFVSSPDSSQATADMDNAVVGQALASLRTIFGGNPTEGERKILLDLQGSSTMPRDVRKSVFARAKALAQRRLEFNKQRADELRGGTFYKEGGGAQTIPSPQGGGGWTVEEQP